MSSQHRWSLRTLAQLPKGSSETARVLLRDVTDRLFDQYQACRQLQQLSDRQPPPPPPPHQHQESSLLHTNLHHLTVVQRDTFEQCQKLLLSNNHSQRILTRWSAADQFYVTALMKQTRDRHAPALERWVDVATEFHHVLHHQPQPQENSSNHSILDNILERRMGIQLLTDHYDRLQKEYFPNGAVHVDKPLVSCLQEAYQEAQTMAEVHLSATPEMVLQLETETDLDETDYTCTVVRSWMDHALVEIFKNAIQATVEKVQHEQPGSRSFDSSSLPPIQVTITSRTAEAVAARSPHLAAEQQQQQHPNQHHPPPDYWHIQITDFGSGLACHEDGNNNKQTNNNNDNNDKDEWEQRRCFGLGQSSVARRWDRLDEQQSYAAVRSPLRGLGVGLTTARLYMRHFGGDVLIRNNRHGNNNNTIGGTASTACTGCTVSLFLPRDDTIVEPFVPSPQLEDDDNNDGLVYERNSTIMANQQE